MGKGGGEQTTGYRYFMDVQMGLCRGPIDELVQINVGDLQAWPTADSSAEVTSGDGAVYGSYVEAVAASIFAPVGSVFEVSGDADPLKDGLWEKTSSGSLFQLTGAGDGTVGMTDTGTTIINAPDLFGGDDKEGGIQGTLWAYFGRATQVLDDIVRTAIGGPLPQFRDVVTLFYRGLICSNNPYPKVWKFRVRRALRGWFNETPWNACEARIDLDSGLIHAMNPAHIIYEALTNPEWGRGLDPLELDHNSFYLASNVLFSEGFGMCIPWKREEDVEVFIQVVVDYIMGAVYIDRGTGLWTLRLIRNDYDPDLLPVFNSTNGLLRIEQDESSSNDQATNELVCNYISPIDGMQKETRVHNQAGYQSSGNLKSDTVDYSYVPTADLAARLGLRELKIRNSQQQRLKLIFDRRAWRITPAAVFKIQAPEYGIDEMIVRAGDTDDGTLLNGEITVTGLQDIFGLPATSYVKPITSTWTPPDQTPVAITEGVLFEPSHYDVTRDSETLADDVTHVLAMARRPNTQQQSFQLWTEPDGAPAYTQRGSDNFCPTGSLSADLGAYDTTFILTDTQSMYATLPNVLIIADDAGWEVCAVTAVNPATGTVSVERGCVDTIPRPHLEGTKVYFYWSYTALDSTAYAEAEIINAKLLSQTTRGGFNLGGQAAISITLVNRHIRPYVPGLMKVNDTLTWDWDTEIDPYAPFDAVLTWAHRDRISQADNLIPSSAASIGPEAGVTYTVTCYDADGVVLRTVTGITDPTWTYDGTMAAADAGFDYVIAEVASVRDGVESWQKWPVKLPLVNHAFADETDVTFYDESPTPLLEEGP